MKKIRDKTEILLTNVQNALEWSSIDDVEIGKSGLKKSFNTIRRNLSVIEGSLSKRPSIAIFGQSQVGKSYLVQNLAKPFNEKFLMIKVADGIDDVEFLTGMNPSGGKESTGLVTRFTTKEIEKDSAFPFEVELFSQLDIAAILTNAFCSDLKDYNEEVFSVEKEDVQSLFENLNTNSIQNGVSEDETYFFNKYINEHFKDHALIRKLSDIGYFDNLETKLHLIAPDKRVELLHLLWGKNQFLTQLFEKLSDGISVLDFQKNIQVGLEALTPQEETIIDVERLRSILDSDSTDFLHVKLQNGGTKKILRSIVAVLSKEVQLQLAHSFKNDEPQSFLNSADLLDFPGSKSREKIPLNVFNNNDSEQKLQLLIRGKVSYLFDSYTNKMGVSTLLYCMDDTPPEEKEAPSRLFKWVKKYVGINKDNRSERLSKTREILNSVKSDVDEISPLLVVFTKFNQELNKVLPGKETDIASHNSKWDARFEENFVNFMSRPVDDKWLKDWTNEESEFKFIFPIRDPLYSQTTFEGFDIQGTEIGIRGERKEAMKAIETSFTQSKVVNSHILNPKEIWSEISSPNGTGILNLSKHLQNSAHPIVTETRLNFELKKAQSDLVEILKPYQVSGNLNEDFKIAKKKGAMAYTSLVGLVNKQDDTLSQVLSNFVVSDTEIWNLLYDYILGGGEKKEEETKIGGTINYASALQDLGVNFDEGMILEDIYRQLRTIYEGLEDEEIDEIIQDNLSINVKEIPHLFSLDSLEGSESEIPSHIVNYWTDRVLKTSLDEVVFQQVNQKQGEVIRTILSEIIKGRDTFSLQAQITAVIKDIKNGTITTEDIDLVASCSATILNKFLFSAGWSFTNEEKKPLLSQFERPIFSNVGIEYSTNELNYTKDSSKLFFKQWAIGVKELFLENVKFSYNLTDRNINTIANQRLDVIIKELQNLN